MATQSYSDSPGAGEKYGNLCHYSQSVTIGAVTKASGQGGWDGEGTLDGNDTALQVKQAFQNVETVLKVAGLKGWEDVYSVRSYHLDIEASFGPMVEALKEACPGHRPIWTAIGVKALALPGMLIEIEVEAIKKD